MWFVPLTLACYHDVIGCRVVVQIQKHLRLAGQSVERIDGSMTAISRQSAVEAFNSSVGARIMLLSLRAGGLGLNLTIANHLFLVDMHWNPMLEAQAVDRIYRVGQTKPVFVHSFLVRGSLEERLAELQVRSIDLLHSHSIHALRFRSARGDLQQPCWGVGSVLAWARLSCSGCSTTRRARR
jgi:hypothetical protein